MSLPPIQNVLTGKYDVKFNEENSDQRKIYEWNIVHTDKEQVELSNV